MDAQSAATDLLPGLAREREREREQLQRMGARQALATDLRSFGEDLDLGSVVNNLQVQIGDSCCLVAIGHGPLMLTDENGRITTNAVPRMPTNVQ